MAPKAVTSPILQAHFLKNNCQATGCQPGVPKRVTSPILQARRTSGAFPRKILEKIQSRTNLRAPSYTKGSASHTASADRKPCAVTGWASAAASP